jgi:hypothetical protein
MSGYAEAQPAGGPRPLPYEFAGWRWSHRSFGPPLPVKILAVVAAFWLFHPLGAALLVFFLWRAARGSGACVFRSQDAAPPSDRAPWARRSDRPAFRNAAFEERRRETLKALDEEAEAFDAFGRKRREAEDREAFERFKAERNTPKGAPDSN